MNDKTTQPVKFEWTDELAKEFCEFIGLRVGKSTDIGQQVKLLCEDFKKIKSLTPSALNDTVVEGSGGIPLPDDFIETNNLGFVGADGIKKPLTDLYEKKYTQSEVDAIRKEAFVAGRHCYKVQIPNRGLGYGDLQFKYESYEQYLSSLNLNSKDTVSEVSHFDLQKIAVDYAIDNYTDKNSATTVEQRSDVSIAKKSFIAGYNYKSIQPTNDNAFVDEHFWEQELHKCKISPYYYYTKYMTANGKPCTTRLSEQEFNDYSFKVIPDYPQSKQSAPEPSELPTKEWEIVSYIGKSTGYIYKLRDGKWSTIGSGTMSYVSFLNDDDSIARSGCEIHSVRRLSDNVVFSVGDKVEYNTSTARGKATIKEFKIDKDRIWAMGNNVPIAPLPYLSKPKPSPEAPPIVKDKEVIWFVNQYWELHSKIKDTHHPADNDKNITVKDKEAGEQYILENKPCLSLNDVKLISEIHGVDEKIRWFKVPLYDLKYSIQQKLKAQ